MAEGFRGEAEIEVLAGPEAPTGVGRQGERNDQI
jgi:hypothetical protein